MQTDYLMTTEPMFKDDITYCHSDCVRNCWRRDDHTRVPGYYSLSCLAPVCASYKPPKGDEQNES